tara:strand:- start:3834 stop:5582 length:1749 start_codon:yes stop_codon:yes gene_type:complete
MTKAVVQIVAEDKTGGTFGKIGGGLDNLKQKSGGLKTALGAAALAMGAFAAVKAIGNKIDEMDDLAKRARTVGSASEESFEKFQVMSQLLVEGGINASEADRAFLNLQSRLEKGVNGNKAYADQIAILGDSILNMDGSLKSTPELFEAVGKAVQDGTLGLEDAQKIMGERVGPKILGVFQNLKDGGMELQEALDEVSKHTDIVDLGAANNAELFNDQMTRMKEGLGSLMTNAITPLLPMLTEFMNNLLANMPGIIEKVKGAFDTLEPVLSLLGTVLKDVVWPIMSKVFEVLGFIAEAITPLVDAAIPAITSGFETLGDIVEKVVGFFQDAVEAITGIIDKAVEMKNKVTGAFGDMKDGAVEGAKGMWQGVTGWFSKTEDDLVGHSIVTDMVDAVLGHFKRMENGAVQSTANMTEAINSTSTEGLDVFSDSIERAFSDGKLTMSDFTGFFKQSMMNMVRDALQGKNGIGSALGGIFGGRKGGGIGGLLKMGANMLFPGLGSFFGGFFAEGGHLPAGKVGIAGEQGPELITGPSNITPIGGMGGNTNVTFQIDNVDATSFDTLLMSRKSMIVGMVRQAAASGRL